MVMRRTDFSEGQTSNRNFNKLLGKVVSYFL